MRFSALSAALLPLLLLAGCGPVTWGESPEAEAPRPAVTAPASLTGDWRAVIDVGGEEAVLDLRLRQTGNEISGTGTSNRAGEADAFRVEGTRNGESVRMRWDYSPHAFVHGFDGSMEGENRFRGRVYIPRTGATEASGVVFQRR